MPEYAWKIPWTEKPGRATVHGVTKSWTWLSDFTFTFHVKYAFQLSSVLFFQHTECLTYSIHVNNINL